MVAIPRTAHPKRFSPHPSEKPPVPLKKRFPSSRPFTHMEAVRSARSDLRRRTRVTLDFLVKSWNRGHKDHWNPNTVAALLSSLNLKIVTPPGKYPRLARMRDHGPATRKRAFSKAEMIASIKHLADQNQPWSIAALSRFFSNNTKTRVSRHTVRDVLLAAQHRIDYSLGGDDSRYGLLVPNPSEPVGVTGSNDDKSNKSGQLDNDQNPISSFSDGKPRQVRPTGSKGCKWIKLGGLGDESNLIPQKTKDSTGDEMLKLVKNSDLEETPDINAENQPTGLDGSNHNSSNTLPKDNNSNPLSSKDNKEDNNHEWTYLTPDWKPDRWAVEDLKLMSPSLTERDAAILAARFKALALHYATTSCNWSGAYFLYCEKLILEGDLSKRTVPTRTDIEESEGKAREPKEGQKRLPVLYEVGGGEGSLTYRTRGGGTKTRKGKKSKKKVMIDFETSELGFWLTTQVFKRQKSGRGWNPASMEEVCRRILEYVPRKEWEAFRGAAEAYKAEMMGRYGDGWEKSPYVRTAHNFIHYEDDKGLKCPEFWRTYVQEDEEDKEGPVCETCNGTGDYISSKTGHVEVCGCRK